MRLLTAWGMFDKKRGRLAAPRNITTRETVIVRAIILQKAGMHA